MNTDDPYELRRFELAQDKDDMYAKAMSELRAGRKVHHWMWFIFPQIAGLGSSSMSRAYAIASLDEARAYLSHPVLGPRLVECARTLTRLSGLSAREILGSIDAKKLRSSMTLFASAACDSSAFEDVLDQYFGGVRDPQTDRLLVVEER